MAFGDSITKANLTFDPTGIGGYPGRLPPLIDCSLPDCEVVNEGLDAEATYQGVTRIETLLDESDWDVVLLMEGTNDIFVGQSNNSIEANLGIMDDKARDHGVDTLHASIIHLDPESSAGQNQNKVNQVADLRLRIMDLADEHNRFFADPWSPLCPNQSRSTSTPQPAGSGGPPRPLGLRHPGQRLQSGIKQRPVPLATHRGLSDRRRRQAGSDLHLEQGNQRRRHLVRVQLPEGSTITARGLVRGKRDLRRHPMHTQLHPAPRRQLHLAGEGPQSERPLQLADHGVRGSDPPPSHQRHFGLAPRLHGRRRASLRVDSGGAQGRGLLPPRDLGPGRSHSRRRLRGVQLLCRYLLQRRPVQRRPAAAGRVLLGGCEARM